jgi:quercetin dioxygenase-like cupin family protein
VVRIPQWQKHWHRAAPGSAMTHLAIQESKYGKSMEWIEKLERRAV